MCRLLRVGNHQSVVSSEAHYGATLSVTVMFAPARNQMSVLLPFCVFLISCTSQHTHTFSFFLHFFIYILVTILSYFQRLYTTSIAQICELTKAFKCGKERISPISLESAESIVF